MAEHEEERDRRRRGMDTEGDDVEGHRRRNLIDNEGDDVEGHLKRRR